jgi:hypothetical protein
MTLSNEGFEKILLEKWSHGENKDKEITKSLFSCEKTILQVHGCIHKENIIVSINPSCMHNFINVQLVNRLQVPIKNIQSTQVEGEIVQIFKDLKITMDKYVLHSDFYAMDMDEVDIVLGYPWIESVGTINISVQKKFLKLWYKKRKSHCRMCLLVRKMDPWKLANNLLSSLKLNQRQSLQKEMKQNYKDIIRKLKRPLTQRNKVLQI